MEQAEFDKFADEYSSMHASNIRASGESPDFFAAYKVRDVAEFLTGVGQERDKLSILDFGGGIGASVPHFHERFPSASLVCLDVSHKSLAIARQLYPGKASFLQFDGATIPLAESSFDVVFAACVFHHIDEREHVRLLSELRRVLKPGGHAFIFEHNPFNPLTVQAVNTCPFDENARLIRGDVMMRRVGEAGYADPVLRYRIFFPGALAGMRPLERYMTRIPVGAQYYVAGCKA